MWAVILGPVNDQDDKDNYYTFKGLISELTLY